MSQTATSPPVRTWMDNADEFGSITRGEGGWPLAILVACSVVAVEPLVAGKVTAAVFAQRAGVLRPTIIKYLNGWATAIENGAPVPPAAELSPADVGAFPSPARPFNGPRSNQWPQGGYVSTKSGSPDVLVGNIVPGSTVTAKIAKSADALKALLDAATPKVIEAVLAEVSDKAFENINAAAVAVTVDAPTEPVITKHGVTPAFQPSAAKLASVNKTQQKVELANAKKFVAALKAKSGIKPKAPDLANDGAPKGGAVGMVSEMIFGDKLWDLLRAIKCMEGVRDLIANHTGPLSEQDREFVVEHLAEIDVEVLAIHELLRVKQEVSDDALNSLLDGR